MKNKITIAGFIVSMLLAMAVQAQGPAAGKDSLGQTGLSKLPARYAETVTTKAEKYYSVVTGKTEKTLERLAKWEEKIKTILEKASPQTAQRLFGNPELTFAGMLQKFREGKAAADNYKGQYNEYRDKLTTSLKYLEDKKAQLDSPVNKSLSRARETDARLNEQLKQTDAVTAFIKERKKLLMNQALQYLGKSKYLAKISKESFYYVETLKNYKQLFSDPNKVEELALKLLNKIPGFDAFVRKNSMLASLFRSTDSPPLGGAGGGGSLAGLQTRAQVNNLIQQQIAAGGPNAQQLFQQNMQAAQGQLNELKNKIMKAGGSSSNDLTPDPSPGGEGRFKPNTQKSKTFKQRLEYGATIQTQKGNSYWPNSSDLGLTLGYKLNDKSVIGIGGSYKLGLGRGINAIKLTSEGIGLRSYIDWKAPFGSPERGILASLWISGGYEQNYRPALRELTNSSIPGGSGEGVTWQQSGLIGISKKISLKTKLLKQTSVRLYWDFLSYRQVPRGQPVVFRIGYNF